MIKVLWKEDASPSLDAAPEPSRQHGILVVGEDESLRGLINNWLMDEGYRVWIAATGLEAIDHYTHHRDAIDVVLMDASMPAMSGPQTLVALRQLDPQVCCCFMTDHLNGYAEMGAETVLRKPFLLMDLDQLLWRLADPIRRQNALQDDLWRDDGGQG